MTGQLEREARALPGITLGPRALADFELLTTGGFDPLKGFMASADYASVLSRMRLNDGALWPIPVVLPVERPLQRGDRVALRHPRGDILGTLDVEDAFEADPEAEARSILGRFDASHPYVAEILRGPRFRVGGRVTALRRVEHADFVDLRLTPAETRARLAQLGRSRVVAFQTRNPLHRSHEELVRRAATSLDATAFIHPVVGLAKPGDVDHFSRVRGYRAVVEKYFERGRAFLSLLPIAMRMAGPREAVWHGLVRRNYGATHLIVGRDHAGPGPGSDGRPLFGPMDAQDLYRSVQAEIGVEMVPFDEMVYLADEDRYEERTAVPPQGRVLSLSGTEVREGYLDAGRPLPAWFMRPEVAETLTAAYPPAGRRGACVWFTGLSGAGKSSTADALRALLLERGRAVTMLDGDEVRRHLSRGLGFSREDRDTNVLRIAFVAGEVVRHGGVAICAAISPYRKARAAARRTVRDAAARGGAFFEVFVDTPLEVCEDRDSKGLYARARRGELRGVSGVDDPYEPPERPEVRFGDDGTSAVERARRLVALLEASAIL